jgi:hypothetical protein
VVVVEGNNEMSHFEKCNNLMNFNLKFSYEKFDFIIIGSGRRNTFGI